MPSFSGINWSVRTRDERLRQAAAEKPRRGAFFSKVKAPTDDERVAMESFLGPRTANFSYPFASTNAWIRGQPEAGTTMLSILGGDSGDIQPVAYYDRGRAGLLSSYRSVAARLRENPATPIPAIPAYRPLAPGDVDMGSRSAQQFLGNGDVWQGRGGLSHLTMVSAQTALDTPLWRVNGPLHRTSSALNDEMRFGTVRRGGLASAPALVRYGSVFAKEMSYDLDTQAGKLAQGRVGHVIEDDGSVARSARTGIPLRSRSRLFNTQGGHLLKEVDEQGNVTVNLPGSASQGVAMDVPAGPASLTVDRNIDVKTRSDINVNASGFASVTARRGYRITTPADALIEGTGSVLVKSNGVVTIATPTPQGIHLGSAGAIKYPVLVGNPVYLSTLSAYFSALAAESAAVQAYGQAAAQAWAAMGAVAMLLDPTGTLPNLCLAAGATAGAMAVAGAAANSANAAHTPTLSSMPGGFLSGKTISE